MAKKIAPPSGSDWWSTQTHLAPNEAAPQPRAGGQKALYWWVLSAAVLMPALIVAMFVMISTVLEPPPEQVSEYEAATRPVARQALEQWLNGDPAPIPDASILSWESVKHIPIEGKVGAPVVDADLHTFAVSSGEARFTVTITIANMEGAPTYIGPPSLSQDPILPSTVDGSALWGNRGQVSTTPEIEEAVRTWSQALFSGDPTKLRQTVGDPNLAGTYLPIQGATWVGMQVTQLTSTDLATEETPTIATALGRVTISYRYGPENKEDPGVTPQTSFDVLIEAADTGSPRITAWGAPGTGPSLAQYSNAQPLPTVVVVVPSVTATEGAPADPAPATAETLPKPTTKES